MTEVKCRKEERKEENFTLKVTEKMCKKTDNENEHCIKWRKHKLYTIQGVLS